MLLLMPLTSGAQAFVRTHVKGHPEVPLFWKSRCVVYHLSVQGSPRTPGKTEEAAIDKTFETWRRAGEACANGWDFARGRDVVPDDFHIGLQGKVNSTQLLFRATACRDVVPADDPCRADPEIAHEVCANAYQCMFSPDETIAVTTIIANTRTGQILDADIEFNAAPMVSREGRVEGKLFTTVDGPVCLGQQAPDCVAYDIQNTLTHEVGHLLGFAHAPDPSSTMYESAAFGETSKRELDEGSRAGLCEVYPRAAAASACVETTSDPLSKLPVRVYAETGCASAPGWPVGLAALVWLARRRLTGSVG